MSDEHFSMFLLVVQVVLVVSTAVWIPLRMRRGILSFIVFSFGVCGAWLAYSVAAMKFDYAVGNDFIGAGYWFLGFLAWMIGTIVYRVRVVMMKRRQTNMIVEPIVGGDRVNPSPQR